MKKIIFVLIVMFFAGAAKAESINSVLTDGKGFLSICEDKMLGFISSCEKEQVKIPSHIDIGEIINFAYLGKNRGYGGKFDVVEIQYNPNKKTCTLRYPYSGGIGTIFVSKCSKVNFN
ncbi:hypothetical protein QV06_01095 [Gallibacterium genomosp. 3]|uniref:Uncharacterized protein n=1 Tax=Gallibacterium genomosp. 3 TaxID=505345 RepID=A0A1A7PVK9_9PAST|nr:hypothetical protein [Gallibacterium genomosp. 3]OBX05757.1 hypothetical protein QV06_01095 [Gallibacterium genomosp. 3]